jgi:hypothetical protein
MERIDWTAVGNALDAHFREVASLQIPQNGTKYDVTTQFDKFGNYWIPQVDSGRFDTTLQNGVLYREVIVNDLERAVDNAFGRRGPWGVMVVGPHGVGKSHSLVNLVLKLQRSRKYLVTFVPDCGRWLHPKFMLQMICGSFGTTPAGVGWSGQVTDDALDDFAKQIEMLLAARKKRWVVVFDQINKLFTKCRTDKMAGLENQYQMIHTIRSVGRVISVISASANNEVADDHTSFTAYNHKIDMEDAELQLLFSILGQDKEKAEEVKRTVGGHPHYVAKYLEDGERACLQTLRNDVAASVAGLTTRFAGTVFAPMVLEAVALSVLGQSRDNVGHYDRKFLVPIDNGTKVTFLPILPVVIEIYRSVHWNDIMEYVRMNEQHLLGVCALKETTPDVRGRLFEAVVIRKITSDGLEFLWKCTDSKLCIDAGRVYHFAGSALPMYSSIQENALYVPDSMKFPAIDFFARTGNLIVAFQAHISKHKDVGPPFLGMCHKSGWLQPNVTVVLIYLSPTEESRKLRPVPESGFIEKTFTRSDSAAAAAAAEGVPEGSKKVYLGSECLAGFPGSLAKIPYPDNGR